MSGNSRKTRLLAGIALFFLLIFFQAGTLYSAPLYYEPVKISLPDGTVLNLFVSGDEYFNWIHDKSGFPVGQGSDGYYYYLLQEGDNFRVTTYRAGISDPQKIAGISQVKIPSWVLEKRNAREKQIEELSATKKVNPHTKSAGTVNNLVIYIKFSGETDFIVSRSVYDQKMNDVTASSMRYYYREVSYNKLDVVSYHMPGGVTSNLTYTDTHVRNYYRPYNISTNPEGYIGDSDRTTREHTLLANAIKWIDENYDLPAGVDFDSDNDLKVDNVCFIVRGTSDGWSDLLWPHRWVLYSRTANIGGLGVWGYTLQLENVSVNTLSHEMFHALGAPDLYHYDNNTVPVGPWDIMANGSCHPGAWMKYKYGKWISSIPEITSSGTYIIKPLYYDGKNCYILRSPLSTQFFVLEYRKKLGLYENNLPASGLIITRIDTRYRGNSEGPPDEIYVYRKDGTMAAGGTISQAVFSTESGRILFNDKSNPFSFLQEGTPSGINIKDIKSMGDSMSFTVDMDNPLELNAYAFEDTTIYLSWKAAWKPEFIVASSLESEKLKPLAGKSYSEGDTIGSAGKIIYRGKLNEMTATGLISDEAYYYSVWVIKDLIQNTYSSPVLKSERTGIYTVPTVPHTENFDLSSSRLPRGWKVTGGVNDPLDNTMSVSFPNSVSIKTDNGKSAWLYSPGLFLTSSNKYMITFRYRNAGTIKSDTLLIRGGSSRDDNAINELKIFTRNAFKTDEFVMYKAVFKSNLTGVYYIGFRTGANGSGVLIDDFRIEPVPPATTEHTDPLEFYPNPSNGIITIPAKEKTVITIFRTGGVVVYETEISSMKELDVSSIGKGLFIIRFKTGDGISTGRLLIL